MFSNDRNIERIADFLEELKHWLALQKECSKLTIIDKVVRIVTALALGMAIAVLVFLTLIYMSFALAYVLGGAMDSMPLGFALVGLFYLVVLLMVFVNRHSWIERPLVQFLVEVLIEENKKS